MILYSPDGEQGDGGQQEETVTLSKKEYEEEKKRLFSGGMKQATEKFTKQEQAYLEKLAGKFHDVTGKPLAEALDYVVQEYDKKGSNETEAMKLLNEKIAGLTSKLTEKDKEVEKEKQDKNNYIIDRELISVLGSKAVDPSDAVALFRNSYRVDRLTNGDIRVYDKSGELVKNSDYEPASLKEVMEEFLTKKPHLAKSENRGGDGAKQRDGVEQTGDVKLNAILAKPTAQRSAEERTAVHEAWKKGKISLADSLK